MVPLHWTRPVPPLNISQWGNMIMWHYQRPKGTEQCPDAFFFVQMAEECVPPELEEFKKVHHIPQIMCQFFTKKIWSYLTVRFWQGVTNVGFWHKCAWFFEHSMTVSTCGAEFWLFQALASYTSMESFFASTFILHINIFKVEDIFE